MGHRHGCGDGMQIQFNKDYAPTLKKCQALALKTYQVDMSIDV